MAVFFAPAAGMRCTAEVRDVFGIKPGDTLLLGDEAQGIAIVKYEGYRQFMQAAQPPKEERP